MYQVIARKYRPQRFAELIGQEHVKTTLENAIKLGRIAHGYIFAGQRGTGKTSVARILARCLNCEQGPTATPCGVCASCREISSSGSVDVIEIDAASNRGINEMRELRENVRYRPARDRYKVFIIDEAHQITSEAFNALLKTLEEPPEWVVFVLCTTEAHKIPTTIASRCQQFSFRSVNFAEVNGRLKWICEQEGIQADEESLAVLTLAGEGSVRDSQSALDQAIACFGSELKGPEVRSLLGMFSVESMGQVTQALAEGDAARMLEIVGDLERNGRDLQHFCRELSRYFRNLLVAKIAGPGTQLIAATEEEKARMGLTAEGFSQEDLSRYLHLTLELFRQLQYSLQPRLHLELGLVRLVYAGKLTSIEDALTGLGGAATPAAPAAGASGKGGGPSRPAPSGGTRTEAARSVPAPSATKEDVSRAPSPASVPDSGAAWRQRLYEALVESQKTFSADAVEHSTVELSGNELKFTAPNEFLFALGSGDVEKAVHGIAGRPLKCSFTAGEAAGGGVEKTATRTRTATEQELTERALADPAVRKFRELFPDSQVRGVRDLRG